jgi:MerR family mercuric resistance operon transcriptional regulator
LVGRELREIADPRPANPKAEQEEGNDATRRCRDRAEKAACGNEVLPTLAVGNVICLIDRHGLNHASCSDYRIKDNFMGAITSPRAKDLSIGELSKHCGVNVETIRYYERIKMLPAPPRTASGRRVYGATERRILAFIRRSRELGFTLEEIRALLALGGPERASCADVHKIARAHLTSVRSKLSDLVKLEAILAETVAGCADGAAPECPVLDILDAGRQ